MAVTITDEDAVGAALYGNDDINADVHRMPPTMPLGSLTTSYRRDKRRRHISRAIYYRGASISNLMRKKHTSSIACYIASRRRQIILMP